MDGVRVGSTWLARFGAGVPPSPGACVEAGAADFHAQLCPTRRAPPPSDARRRTIEFCRRATWRPACSFSCVAGRVRGLEIQMIVFLDEMACAYSRRARLPSSKGAQCLAADRHGLPVEASRHCVEKKPFAVRRTQQRLRRDLARSKRMNDFRRRLSGRVRGSSNSLARRAVVCSTDVRQQSWASNCRRGRPRCEPAGAKDNVVFPRCRRGVDIAADARRPRQNAPAPAKGVSEARFEIAPRRWVQWLPGERNALLTLSGALLSPTSSAVDFFELFPSRICG